MIKIITMKIFLKPDRKSILMKTIRIFLSVTLLWLLVNFDISAQCTTGSIQGVQSSYFVNQTYQFRYSDSGSIGSNFFWSSTIGGVISGDNAAQEVYVFSSTTGIGEICVTRFGDNTRPSSECIPINFQPCPTLSTPSDISGSSSITACGSYTYAVNAIPNATKYLWTGFRNASITTTTPTITITPSDLNTGLNTISVQALNDCGNSSSFSSALNITMTLAVQENPTTISGPSSITYCQNMFYTYSTPVITGAVEYHWGGTFVGFSTIITTLPSIDISDTQMAFQLGSFPKQTTLTLKTKDTCGVFSNEITYSVMVNPPSPNPINWPTNLCRSSSRNYTFSVIPISQAYQYTWTGTFGTRITTSSILTLSGSQFSAGNQTVSVQAVLSCSNSWSSITSRSIQVSNLNLLGICPSGTSVASFTISPNPSNGDVILRVEKEDISKSTKHEIRIYDANGTLFFNKQTVETELNIDGLGLKEGIYFIDVRDGDYRETKRIVVNKK
jgi:hypothetical protein